MSALHHPLRVATSLSINNNFLLLEYMRRSMEAMIPKYPIAKERSRIVVC